MKIVWTRTAEVSFQLEIDFIILKWTNKQAFLFVDLVKDILKKLEKFPLLGKSYENDIMHLVVSKQTTLIYRILEGEIVELLLFWNNKQNPKDLEKAIKESL